MFSYNGGCNCKNIRLQFHSGKTSAELPVRQCACEFCQKHKALYTSDPSGSVAITIRNEEQVDRQRFGTKTADFLICKNCGDYVAASVVTENGSYAVINIQALEQKKEFPKAAVVFDFSNETLEQRRTRWIKNWTPVI